MPWRLHHEQDSTGVLAIGQQITTPIATLVAAAKSGLWWRSIRLCRGVKPVAALPCLAWEGKTGWGTLSALRLGLRRNTECDTSPPLWIRIGFVCPALPAKRHFLRHISRKQHAATLGGCVPGQILSTLETAKDNGQAACSRLELYVVKPSDFPCFSEKPP